MNSHFPLQCGNATYFQMIERNADLDEAAPAKDGDDIVTLNKRCNNIVTSNSL